MDTSRAEDSYKLKKATTVIVYEILTNQEQQKWPL